MDLERADEPEELRRSVRRFLSERAPVRPWVRARIGEPGGTTPEVWRGLAELGLPGLLIPEAHGGAGLGLREMAVALEELGRAVHPGPFLASAVGATSLLLAAEPAERARWLPDLACGRRIASLAPFEPGARWSWRAPGTRARQVGAGWVLEGAKAPVPEAFDADWIVVTARDDAGELGVFVVERGHPGVELEPRAIADATRKESRLRLAAAPASRLACADAEAAVAAALDRMAVGLALDGVGAAGRALELAVEHARVRVQFDQPIGAFQAVQHLLVDMLRDLELGRAAAAYAARVADAGDPAESRRAAALAKAFASDAFPRIGESAIQVFGGLGFTWEHDVQLYYKRLLGVRHAFGDAAWHLETLACIALDGDARGEGE